MTRPRHHVFVCTNERGGAPGAGQPSCGARGGGAVFAALQRAIGARAELWGRVAVTSCGCLGPCFEGPALVVYPDGAFYAGVTPGDAEELVERHLVHGEPVARLRLETHEDEPPDG
jgi:(2Fe-2S) ferredoxin